MLMLPPTCGAGADDSEAVARRNRLGRRSDAKIFGGVTDVMSASQAPLLRSRPPHGQSR